MDVFITGGSGYIGQATIRALRARGHVVTALVRTDKAAETIRGLGATPIHGALTDTETLRASADRADAVIHLAQAAGDTAANDRAASDALQDGLAGRPYVHTGGVWVYGNTAGVVDETAPFAPPALVAWRLDNEKHVLDRSNAGGHPVIVMPGVVYGGGQGLIEQFFVAPARTRGAVHYIGAGANHCALVHVADVADLYVRALAAPAGAMYAGVADEAPTFRTIADAASQAAGCPGAVVAVSMDQARDEMGPIADAFALDQQISNARAARDLGWHPAPRDLIGELTKP